ncbi:bifunctional UDP-N-acetylglucosamine diphosphorylase/glucosamine-1-phosphate N-acetyltransferase GlmU (plasmid) [Shimia sp. W99]
MTLALIILAAGKGTRMKSDLPKVLHRIGGVPLIVHAIESGSALTPARTIVVAGHGAEHVEASVRAYAPDVDVVLQTEQLGTAHAVAQARQTLAGFDGDAVILYGDTPFITAETLMRMRDARNHADVVVLGFEADDPGRYGRLVTEGDRLMRIVEFKDATDAERDITLCNSGVVMADAQALFGLIDAVTNDNASGEYYLTDTVSIANAHGLKATTVSCPQAETMGVDSRSGLARAEALFQARARAALLEKGVTVQAPETVWLSFDTSIGRETVIEPHVVFGTGVTIESGAHIRAFSHLEGCHIADGAIIGPYARIRSGSRIGESARIGNFVETKNTDLGPGAKINHLSYVGDASVGANSNIGAGTITCNYDGVLKHRTEIGEGAFIGTNTALVAPVRVGSEAMTAAGSVITDDVPDGALAIARAEQTTRPELARRQRKRLLAKKAQQEKT